MQHSLCVRIMQLSSVGMLPDNVTYFRGYCEYAMLSGFTYESHISYMSNI